MIYELEKIICREYELEENEISSITAWNLRKEKCAKYC